MQKMFFKFNPLFLVFTFQMMYQYPIQHETTLKPLNLLTINLKWFLNSIEWSELHLQANILPWLGKVFRFRVFKLLENAFCKTPSHLIWSPYAEQSPYKFSPQNLSLMKNNSEKKSPSTYFRGEKETLKAKGTS